jgi:hypothetical protein
VEVHAVAVDWESTYTSNEKYVCWETTLGHVIMSIIIFALIGAVFHGPHGTGLHTEPSFKRALLPLTAVKAPVTL